MGDRSRTLGMAFAWLVGGYTASDIHLQLRLPQLGIYAPFAGMSSAIKASASSSFASLA
ncbi:MAG: hypothetical protein AAF974_04310 [Cyanobacteria bacterium P01_E01_bin.34]